MKPGFGNIEVTFRKVAIPDAPTELVATVISATQIDLAWTNTEATSIECSTDGITYSEIDTVAKGTNTYENTELTAGTTYYYKTRAYIGTNYSTYSNVASATISTLLNNLVFSLKWDGSQFINVVTGLAMVDHASVAVGNPVVPWSEPAPVFVTANNKYLSTPDTPALSMGDVDFMIALRCNISNVAVNQVLASHYLGTGDQRSWAIHIVASKFVFGISNDGTGAGYKTLTSGTIYNNTSYFVLVWHDATANTINMQISARTIYSSAHTTGVFDSNTNIEIGSLAGTSCAGGRISIDIWKGRLLSATELIELFAGGAGNKHPFNVPVVNKIIIMGDKTAGSNLTNNALVHAAYVAQNPDVIIGIGDYDDAVNATATLMAGLENIIKFAAPGNHDDWVWGVRTEFNANFNGGGYKRLSFSYVDFFLYDPWLKMDETGYYTSVTAARAISLATRQASTQGQWLINGLVASTAKFKVVIFHEPAWATRVLGWSGTEVVEMESMRWDWFALGANLILNGHLHFYERMLKNTGSGTVPIIMCGTSGANQIDWDDNYIEESSIIRHVSQRDSDFGAGHLITMNVTSDRLQIDLSGVDTDGVIHPGKDQLILT